MSPFVDDREVRVSIVPFRPPICGGERFLFRGLEMVRAAGLRVGCLIIWVRCSSVCLQHGFRGVSILCYLHNAVHQRTSVKIKALMRAQYRYEAMMLLLSLPVLL